MLQATCAQSDLHPRVMLGDSGRERAVFRESAPTKTISPLRDPTAVILITSRVEADYHPIGMSTCLSSPTGGFCFRPLSHSYCYVYFVSKSKAAAKFIALRSTQAREWRLVTMVIRP